MVRRTPDYHVTLMCNYGTQTGLWSSQQSWRGGREREREREEEKEREWEGE